MNRLIKEKKEEKCEFENKQKLMQINIENLKKEIEVLKMPIQQREVPKTELELKI